MKVVLRLAGLLALVAWMPTAYAADLSGTWKGAFDFQGASVPLVFHLAIAGGAVTGTVEGLPTTPTAIHDGKVDGDAVTFWVNTDYQGQTYRLIYKGKVAATGDSIAFTLGTDDGSWSTQLTAAKDEGTAAPAVPALPDVTGTWKGAFDFQGASVPLVFHLAIAGGAVTGTVEGLPTTPTAIHDGKVDGDAVTFWVNTDYQGQTYRLVCKGKITAGQIVFTIGTDDASWGTQLTVTKGA